MSAVNREQIEKVLAEVVDVNLDKDLISAGVVKNIEIEESAVNVSIELNYPANGYRHELVAAVQT